jgi:hypothetical protein
MPLPNVFGHASGCMDRWFVVHVSSFLIVSVAAFGLNARENSELATPRLYYTWSGRVMFRDSYCLPCTSRTHHLVDMRLACAVILLCAGWVDAAALRDNPAFMMVSGISSPAEMCLVVANGMSTSG